MAKYHFPPIDRLNESTEYSPFTDSLYISALKEKIANMFQSFGMNVKIVDSLSNKYSVLLSLKLGGKVTARSVRKLKEDIEVISGGHYIDFMDGADGKSVTIAIKNEQRPKVMIKDIIRSSAFSESDSILPIAAGINLFAGDMIFDLAALPNLIVLGVTGSGKSTFLNDIILSILYKKTPDEVSLAMIDTKGVDLPPLNGIPHMKDFDVAKTAEDGLAILKWLKNEAIERTALMYMKKAETLEEYNQFTAEKKTRYVLMIDEYSDFKEKCGEDVDQMIASLAGESSRTGIHIVLATQSARKEHLSAVIKEAIPSRACLVVADERESRIAIDRIGAARLAGNGDMIFTKDGNDRGVRLQAAYASDEEIDRVAMFLRNET